MTHELLDLLEHGVQGFCFLCDAGEAGRCVFVALVHLPSLVINGEDFAVLIAQVVVYVCSGQNILITIAEKEAITEPIFGLKWRHKTGPIV